MARFPRTRAIRLVLENRCGEGLSTALVFGGLRQHGPAQLSQGRFQAVRGVLDGGGQVGFDRGGQGGKDGGAAWRRFLLWVLFQKKRLSRKIIDFS